MSGLRSAIPAVEGNTSQLLPCKSLPFFETLQFVTRYPVSKALNSKFNTWNIMLPAEKKNYLQ